MALWGKIIVPFLGDSFSEAVIENSSWLVNAGGITLFRAVSFFPDPHMFSFYLGMSAFPVLALYFANAKHRHIYLILFFVILFADLLTFSRGGYLGMSAGLIVFIAIISAKGVFLKKIIANKYLLSSIFSAVFIFLAIPNPIAERLYSSFDLSEGSNSQRLTIWKNSWDMIKKNPLTGVGLGNYSLELKPSADYREPIYSHNAYMDIAAETGLVNASVFLLILFLSIYNSIKIFNRDNNFIYLGIASSITVFSFHSVFETAIFSVHVLPLFALFAGMANAQNNERRN
ncbi:MAG: O-antigen ligase family protein [Candidatus Moranbacteria bacterium]|jgi:O-antigen ligase|nr:O-antigen ligase family protein [Candidatus Moranbacteria bacterium]MDD5651961.1 O-antigen ligase family protein [Candidatus Moranbacteria bacterium]MDX9855896.1 O-antigen ligase family protein [Candidatus Moranbacteria bacterium]